MSVIDGIFARYKQYGWHSPEYGEWNAINVHARRWMKRALELGCEECLRYQFQTMFRQPITAGLATTNWNHVAVAMPEPACYAKHMDGLGTATRMIDSKWIAEHHHAIKTDIIEWTRYTDEVEDATCLDMPPCGEPITVRLRDWEIAADTPRHDRYARLISKYVPTNGQVLIIGPGYGGTVRQLMMYRSDITVWMIDIPDTLYIAWYWLTQSESANVRWHDEEPKGSKDAVLFPAMLKWPQDHGENKFFDLVLAAHCLSEFSPEIVADYIRNIDLSGSRYFLHDSAHGIAHVPDDALCAAYPEQSAHTMNPGEAYEELWRAPTKWQGTGMRYWEFMFERKNFSANNL